MLCQVPYNRHPCHSITSIHLTWLFFHSSWSIIWIVILSGSLCREAIISFQNKQWLLKKTTFLFLFYCLALEKVKRTNLLIQMWIHSFVRQPAKHILWRLLQTEVCAFFLTYPERIILLMQSIYFVQVKITGWVQAPNANRQKRQIPLPPPDVRWRSQHDAR